jgi:hypothetical protein
MGRSDAACTVSAAAIALANAPATSMRGSRIASIE